MQKLQELWVLNQLDHNTAEGIPGAGMNKMGKQGVGWGKELSISATYWALLPFSK